MDVQIGPRTEVTMDRSDQGPKWPHTLLTTVKINQQAYGLHTTEEEGDDDDDVEMTNVAK